MSAWELTNITARLILPPGVFIVLALLGLALIRARLRFGTALVAFSVVVLYALSTPFVSAGLLRTLEPAYSDPANDATAGAIVILAGGTRPRAAEYGSDTASAATLERLRYGVALQRRTGKPILLTGGNPAQYDLAEAEVMKVALREFGATAKWVEAESHNTIQSARLTAEILKKAGVRSIYLVTHAWHMPRARMSFERVGLHVVPAPMAYVGEYRLRIVHFVPSGRALDQSYLFFHEVFGLLWYRLRFDLGK